MQIVPILLAGGSGKRLWPVSRKSYPKQFSELIGEKSLFQDSVNRVTGSASLSFTKPVVLTNADFRFIVLQQIDNLGLEPGAVLIEPEGRNTAPAILAAALHAQSNDPDAVMLVTPSDHLIPDTDAFHAAIAEGLKATAQGQIVTFGIAPTRPEIGYGYLELDTAPTSAAAVPLKSFVEKPDRDTAQRYLDSGSYLWNAGIFLFRARDMVAAFEQHSPGLIAPVSEALKNGTPDLGFLRLEPDAWGKCDDISIDYAIMEKVPNLSVVPYAGEWSDLGQWDAVWQQLGPDGEGVVEDGNALAIDCHDTLLRSHHDGLQVVGIGLKNIVAVAMPDAVLVADMNSVNKVGDIVGALKLRHVDQAEIFPKDHRPWGWFESLAIGGRFQVKRILVNPGAALSLQSHVHRAEHWIVVQGTAKVTIDDEVKLVTENQSVYIPLGAVHRMENPGKTAMVLIEVQTGAYLGEDDIVRYEDVYARN